MGVALGRDSGRSGAVALRAPLPSLGDPVPPFVGGWLRPSLGGGLPAPPLLFGLPLRWPYALSPGRFGALALRFSAALSSAPPAFGVRLPPSVFRMRRRPRRRRGAVSCHRWDGNPVG